MILCPIEKKKTDLETLIVVGLKLYLKCLKG